MILSDTVMILANTEAVICCARASKHTKTRGADTIGSLAYAAGQWPPPR
jgi:hypothetical protein